MIPEPRWYHLKIRHSTDVHLYFTEADRYVKAYDAQDAIIQALADPLFEGLASARVVLIEPWAPEEVRC